MRLYIIFRILLCLCGKKAPSRLFVRLYLNVWIAVLQSGKIIKTFECNCYHKTQPLRWPTGCTCHNNTISSYCSRFLNAIVFILVLFFHLFQIPPGSWVRPWVRGIAAASPQMRLQTAVWPFTRRSSLWTRWWRCRPCHSVSNFWVGMLPDLNLWNNPGFFSQQAHTDILTDLHFTLAFAHCVLELASSKEMSLNAVSSADVSFLEQSLVTDQISQLSKDWRWACVCVLVFLHWLHACK